MIDRLVAERFTLFGQDVVLASDSAEVLAALVAVYERHIARGQAPVSALGPVPRPAVQVRVLGPAGGGGAVIEVLGRRIRVPSATQIEHFAHLVMINAAAALAHGRIVLHAGAVVRDGQGTLIVGPSGWGKTSLTLELVRRGWEFLSDDFAPISATGLVEPFPRRVSLTDPSLALLGMTPPVAAVPLSSVGGQRKWMTDIEDLFGRCIAGPAQLRTVFVMAALPEVDTGWTRWRVRLSRPSDQLVRDLEHLDGVRLQHGTNGEEGAKFDLYTKLGVSLGPALENACLRHDSAVVAADVAKWSEPSFESGPSATALALTETIPELTAHSVSASARNFLGAGGEAGDRRDSALLQGAIAATNARVFRLAPGPLAHTADLVEQLSSA